MDSSVSVWCDLKVATVYCQSCMPLETIQMSLIWLELDHDLQNLVWCSENPFSGKDYSDI